jgi:hypothetical protein
VTISPPPNVKLAPDEPARVLASGFDGLVLSMNIVWENERFFWLLDEVKELAKGTELGVPLDLYDTPETFSSVILKPHGSDGYEWLLIGKEFTLKIGNWMEPKTRPSAMLECRSEALWHQGPRMLVSRVRKMLERVGAKIQVIKPSRVDQCVDVLLPASSWGLGIADHLVTRAIKDGIFRANRKATGITVGSGDLLARIYDKPLEIIMKSNKIWMFDVWGIPSVPSDHFIIRVENQVRREALKQLGIDTFDDLLAKAAALWSYSTRSWLKVQDDPSKHHTQQKTLPWWEVVQDGFLGVQGENPLVRTKAMRADRKQLTQQIVGQIASLMALHIQGCELNGERKLSIVHSMGFVREAIMDLGITNEDFTEKVKLKFAKYRRSEPPKK